MLPGNRLRVLLGVAMVLLAGCAGLGPDGTDTRGGEGATTVAPGVTEGTGLANASALLSSHRQSLNASGFTYRFDYRRTERLADADGSSRETLESAVTGRVAAESGVSPFISNETDRSTDPATSTVLFVDADRAAERIVRGDEVTVEESFEDVNVLETTHYLMGDYLSEAAWTVSERRDDGVVLEAGPTWTDWEHEQAGDRNVSTRRYFDGELVVANDGTIRRMTVNRTNVERVTVDGTLQTRGRTVRLLEYELLATDETDVERPAWVDDALNETTTSEARLGSRSD